MPGGFLRPPELTLLAAEADQESEGINTVWEQSSTPLSDSS